VLSLYVGLMACASRCLTVYSIVLSWRTNIMLPIRRYIATTILVCSACATDPNPNDSGDDDRPAAGAPAAPTILNAQSTSDTAISLTWTDVSDNESGFVLERASADVGPYASATMTPADTTTYIDSGLTAATTYFYRVRATNAIGSSAPSAPASARTQDPPKVPPSAPPVAPDGLIADAIAADAVKLQWVDHSGNETGFRVERSTSTGGPFTEVAITAANEVVYEDRSLAASTTYYYRVRATNNSGNSAYSAVTAVTTHMPPVIPPSAPSSLAAGPQSSTRIRLSWSDTSANESGFKVERALAAAGPFSQFAVTAANATTHEDAGLAPATTYYYRVRATNLAGDSGYTAVVSATTLAAQICAPSETRCVAGAIASQQTCNATGTAWVSSTCQGFSLCSNRQCRVVCDLNSPPANPTLCVVPNQDNVNNGEWLYWSDSRLAFPANTRGGSLRNGSSPAPVISSGQVWPYAWSISQNDSAFTQFKLNQFSFPRSQRLSFRAKRAGIVATAINNFLIGIFNGRSTLISRCLFGPVPFAYTTTSCFNGPPFGSQLSYDGTFNSMLLSITGDGFGGLVDNLHVNWVALSIEP
jgi:hypothetical protein